MSDDLLNDCDLLAGEDEQKNAKGREAKTATDDDEQDERRKKFIKESKKKSDGDDSDEDDDSSDKPDWRAVVQALKRLVEEARPEKKMIALATVALLLSTVLGLAIPRFFGEILDTASAAGGKGADDAAAIAAGTLIQTRRGQFAVGLVVVIVGSSIMEAVRDILFSISGQRVVLRLRKRLFQHMLQQDVAFFDKNKSGELVNRLSADVMMLQSAVEHSWAQFISCERKRALSWMHDG